MRDGQDAALRALSIAHLREWLIPGLRCFRDIGGDLPHLVALRKLGVLVRVDEGIQPDDDQHAKHQDGEVHDGVEVERQAGGLFTEIAVTRREAVLLGGVQNVDASAGERERERERTRARGKWKELGRGETMVVVV